MTPVPAYQAPIPPVGPGPGRPAWPPGASPQDRPTPTWTPPGPARPVVVVARKSIVLAALLPTLFGPIGLLYAAPVAALVAVVVLVGGLVSSGFFLALFGWLALWPVFALWSVLSALRHNARLRALACAGP